MRPYKDPSKTYPERIRAWVELNYQPQWWDKVTNNLIKTFSESDFNDLSEHDKRVYFAVLYENLKEEK